MGIVHPDDALIFRRQPEVFPDGSKRSHHREKTVTGDQGVLTPFQLGRQFGFQVIRVPAAEADNPFPRGCGPFRQAVMGFLIQEDHLVKSHFIQGLQACQAAQITGGKVNGIFGIKKSSQLLLQLLN